MYQENINQNTIKISLTRKNALSDQLKTSIAKERYYLKKLGKNF